MSPAWSTAKATPYSRRFRSSSHRYTRSWFSSGRRATKAWTARDCAPTSSRQVVLSLRSPGRSTVYLPPPRSLHSSPLAASAAWTVAEACSTASGSATWRPGPSRSGGTTVDLVGQRGGALPRVVQRMVGRGRPQRGPVCRPGEHGLDRAGIVLRVVALDEQAGPSVADDRREAADG